MINLKALGKPQRFKASAHSAIPNLKRRRKRSASLKNPPMRAPGEWPGLLAQGNCASIASVAHHRSAA
jgi:hypothetical protein